MPIEKHHTTSPKTERSETAEAECLERLYRKIGISAVAAAMRYQGQEIVDGTQPVNLSGAGPKGRSQNNPDQSSRRKAHRAA